MATKRKQRKQTHELTLVLTDECIFFMSCFFFGRVAGKQSKTDIEDIAVLNQLTAKLSEKHIKEFIKVQKKFSELDLKEFEKELLTKMKNKKAILQWKVLLQFIADNAELLKDE